MAFRREVFDQIGYFDEKIKFGHEETLLIEEARNHFDIYYDPDLCVIHRFCDSPIDFWKKWWRYGVADAYLQQCRGNLVPERIHRFVPLTFDETLEGTVVLSVGKALRLVNFLRSKVTGSGWN